MAFLSSGSCGTKGWITSSTERVRRSSRVLTLDFKSFLMDVVDIELY